MLRKLAVVRTDETNHFAAGLVVILPPHFLGCSLGRNKQYAAVEYSSEVDEFRPSQLELLGFLLGELEGEFFEAVVEENRLVADWHLVADAGPIKRLVS